MATLEEEARLRALLGTGQFTPLPATDFTAGNLLPPVPRPDTFPLPGSIEGAPGVTPPGLNDLFPQPIAPGPVVAPEMTILPFDQQLPPASVLIDRAQQEARRRQMRSIPGPATSRTGGDDEVSLSFLSDLFDGGEDGLLSGRNIGGLLGSGAAALMGVNPILGLLFGLFGQLIGSRFGQTPDAAPAEGTTAAEAGARPQGGDKTDSETSQGLGRLPSWLIDQRSNALVPGEGLPGYPSDALSARDLAAQNADLLQNAAAITSGGLERPPLEKPVAPVPRQRPDRTVEQPNTTAMSSAAQAALVSSGMIPPGNSPGGTPRVQISPELAANVGAWLQSLSPPAISATIPSSVTGWQQGGLPPAIQAFSPVQGVGPNLVPPEAQALVPAVSTKPAILPTIRPAMRLTDTGAAVVSPAIPGIPQQLPTPTPRMNLPTRETRQFSAPPTMRAPSGTVGRGPVISRGGPAGRY